MASPEILDISKLLEPVSEEFPTGPDLRENSSPDSSYQRVKAERNAARAAERSSIHDGNSSQADDHWRTVIDLTPRLLESESKDLEVASWYLEALVRRHGFQGLRDGFKIIHDLIERYWDGLYPMPDEDGIETRVASLAGLNGEGAEGVLIAPIRKVLITEGQSVGPYSFWEYQQALDVDKMNDADGKATKSAKLGFTLSDFEKAVAESSQEYFVNQRDDIEATIDLCKRTGVLLDQNCGSHHAPSLRNIIDVLEQCRGAINHVGKSKFPVENVDADPEGAQADEQSSAGAGSNFATQQVGTREVAFRQLTEIAAFFRRTEPHSPISYVIEKAVKWGEMPLNELVKELISDNSSLTRFSELTGVKVDD